jgi:hypothetical protein
VWRDNLGNTAIWFMSRTTVASMAGVGNIPTNWSVAGTGDFNGDGFADIVWRDTAGDTSIWLMNGAMSVRALAWLGGIDSFGRGETTWPALWHAPDSGQQPHRPPAHGAGMIVVAEAHSGSSCGSAGATCPRRDAER